VADAPAAPAEHQPTTLIERVRHPTLGASLGLFVILAGWLVGLRPLSDNSFLTHLATGRIILDTGSVPSVDPYTFTAAGEPWVVQSWLPGLLYAAAEAVGGLDGVRVVVGLLAALLTGLAWTLLRPADGIVVRLAVAGLFVGVGASLWAERPFMIGLCCMALLLLTIEGRFDARWLLPLGWVWVNSHGSFPIGIGLLVVSLVGRRLDGDAADAEWRALRWFVPGVLLGAVGPLGLDVLVFPLQLISQQDVLRNVIEWRAPGFTTTSQRLFLVQLALVIFLLVRRPSYRGGLLVAVFSVLALTSMRNLTVASLVFLPVMAPALAGIGSLSSRERSSAARVLGVAGVAAVAVLTLARSNQSDLDLGRYPVPALAFLEANDVDTSEVRMASIDFVGNFVDYVYGPEQRTYYDDRFDMFPEDVTEMHLGLITARPRMRGDLDELDIDLTLLRADSESAQILTLDEVWRPLFIDDTWMLACRRGADLGGDLGTC
jgi:hypothetical protein